MTWWINVILGLLIGSFLATYYEGYRKGFKGIFNFLAKKVSKTDEKPKTEEKK